MASLQTRPSPRKRVRKRRRRVQSVSSSSSSSSSDSESESQVNSNVDTTLAQLSSDSSSLDSSSDSESQSGSDAESSPQDACSPPAPSFANDSAKNTQHGEEILKERFRKFWMASVADAFQEDLEEIRKEPNLGPSRLALLIDSLASGANVFSSSSKDGGINGMEAAIGPNP